MSRKITKESIAAFLAGTPFNKANMSVVVFSEHTGQRVLRLHGNDIARFNIDGKLEITDAGWATRTTRERLNGLPGVAVFQRKHQQYLAPFENGVPNFKLAIEWDGAWVSVNACKL